VMANLIGVVPGLGQPKHLQSEVQQRIDDRSDHEFYQRFEDRYRGGNDLIADRLEPYLADLAALPAGDGPVVDIGAGRGEWLSLLAERGYPGIGVDTNDAAIARCHELGLTAVLGDGIAYLQSLEPGSVRAVTSFHVFEHVPPKVYRELVQAAFRSLQPGGVLIVETPNPTNLTVGAASFYLDPTHLRPVNPDYLAFLLEDVGFSEVEIRFLHPNSGYQPSEGPTELSDELMWALRGPQDFAAVARVPVGEEIPM
jgi:SAM-dependent methyltransferase